MKVLFQIWEDPDGLSVTTAPAKACAAMKEWGGIDPAARLLHEYEAISINDAFRQSAKLRGVEDYEPMRDDNGNLYPEGEAEFVRDPADDVHG